MKKFYSILFILLLPCVVTFATHNRAGEITYRQISQLTYEITITTFTYTKSAADRSQLEVDWGDNTSSIAPRIPGLIIYLPDFYKKNTYKATHTFPGPGTYEIVVQDPNRNLGVRNIPNSVNVIFSIKTTLIINPNVGFNNTPVLLNYPIDKAAKGKTFIHNPAAFDYDGDSISYSLTVCTGEDGIPIPDYTLPEATNSLTIDPITGDLIWDTPAEIGIYNVAMNITEWRKGIKIGNIVRDMQIEVVETNNNPPVNEEIGDICVIAGDTIDFTISATDVDNDRIRQSAVGGTFVVDPSSSFTSLENGDGYSVSEFEWLTSCSHVRNEPYYIVYKSEDYFILGTNDTLKTVDIDNFNIRVLGPPPENLLAFPETDTIKIRWDAYSCPNISSFKIYRAPGIVNFQPDSCSNVIPPELGFIEVGEVSSDQNLFSDNKSNGLEQGVEYSYIVVAVFENGTLSIPSIPVVSSLLQGMPAILQVSVENIGETDGTIQVAWMRPPQDLLDSLDGGAPYQYELLRALPGDVDNFTQLQTFDNLDDTTYLDENINTLEFPYYYQVNLYYTSSETGNLELANNGGMASSTYLEILPSDNTNRIKYLKDAAWRNLSDSVFLISNDAYELIDVISGTNTYSHEGLINGVEYTYQLVGLSQYQVDSAIYRTINKTHPNSGIPIDTVPPCPPEFNVESLCDSAYNLIQWQLPIDCTEDEIIEYRIYYSPTENEAPALIETIDEPSVSSYKHYSEVSLAGCYQLTAVDSTGNESPKESKICIDVCNLFELPNVFSPNGDNINDIYKSLNINNFVKEVDMKIFNRWGNLVYETTDPDINWDGRNKDNKKIVSPGVYYYICDVYEPRITGLYLRNITGFIHVYSDESRSVNQSSE